MRINVLGKHYQAHRLAWLYVTGEWPLVFIDHRDANGLNNSWNNLRAADRNQNLQNRGSPRTNTSGFKGVYFNKQAGKWLAQIGANGKHTYLGVFVTPEEAHAAYCKAAAALHGEFARTD